MAKSFTYRPIPDNEDMDVEVIEALYGDGLWEITKAMQPHEKKDRREAALTKIAAGGNAVSAMAGPAAVYSAFRSAKSNTGGIPRDIATAAGTKLSRSSRPVLRKVGQQTMRGVRYLNSPKSRKAKIAAGAAGATMVGLQVGNAAIDGLSAKLLTDKSKQAVKKSDEESRSSKIRQVKNKLVRTSVDGVYYTLRKIPQSQIKEVPKTQVHKSEGIDFAIRGEICKMNSEKKQVFGWASVLEVNGEPVIDLQGDVMTIETIEKAAYKYVHGSRKGGHQHKRDGDEPLHVSDMIESFVLTPEKKEKMGIPDSVPTGWWVGFKVNDDDTWQAYKNGELKDFSLHGTGRRVPLDV